MAAEMRAAGIIAGFCPKGAKDAKAAFGALRPPRPSRRRRLSGETRNRPAHFRILWDFNGLQAGKFSHRRADAARVSRAFTVSAAMQSIKCRPITSLSVGVKKVLTVVSP